MTSLGTIQNPNYKLYGERSHRLQLRSTRIRGKSQTILYYSSRDSDRTRPPIDIRTGRIGVARVDIIVECRVSRRRSRLITQREPNCYRSRIWLRDTTVLRQTLMNYMSIQTMIHPLHHRLPCTMYLSESYANVGWWHTTPVSCWHCQKYAAVSPSTIPNKSDVGLREVGASSIIVCSSNRSVDHSNGMCGRIPPCLKFIGWLQSLD